MNDKLLLKIVNPAILGQLREVDAVWENEYRMSHFLAQCSHESGHFRHVIENLNYSVDGILKTFKTRISSKSDAARYARNPQALANKVYANKNGNGDERSGDGWLYRGRGYIGLTGRKNYGSFAYWLNNSDILRNPDLVATAYPMKSAEYFFMVNDLWSICDKGLDAVPELTNRINGGFNGLKDRINLTNRFYSILSE